MKTYVITLSTAFPKTHSRAGEATYFRDRFFYGQGRKGCQGKDTDCLFCGANYFKKIHTIRANYPLWKKRIEEIQLGKACLSVREWTGKPYRSKQVEIKRLTAEDRIGIQKLTFYRFPELPLIEDRAMGNISVSISGNDGLTLEDWVEWFKGYDLKKPLVIIHFTPFRY